MDPQHLDVIAVGIFRNRMPVAMNGDSETFSVGSIAKGSKRKHKTPSIGGHLQWRTRLLHSDSKSYSDITFTLRISLAVPTALLVATPLVAASSKLTLRQAGSGNSQPGVTIFFENDGNWTTHGSKPSAIFVNIPMTQVEADETCAEYGESLLDCSSFYQFENEFSYQEYLGAINPGEQFWSACSTDSPVNTRNVITLGQEGSNAATYPFLCTNSAPFVDKVDTDYSTFPRMNVSSNGTTFEGIRDHMTFRFAGIPFAEAPTEELRFMPAQAWESTSYVNATAYSPACLQYGYFDGNSYGLNPWGNSEDCLYLNVYTPFIPDSESTPDPDQGKPVMVWIYGGGETQGSAADSTFDGASITTRSDVVLVTINYRLNIFGLLTLDDGIITGNQMLTDKIQALRWVKQYIAGFGGNPNNVTIFGQSAGGASVTNLISAVNIIGENLFQNAIIQSAKSNVETAASAAAAVLPYIEALCPNTTNTTLLDCQQKLPADTVLNVTNEATSWSMVIDGITTIDYPPAQFALGPQYINSVNVLAGNMMEEYQALATTTLAPNMANFTEAVLVNLTGSSAISDSQANMILDSGRWLVSNNTFNNGSISYSSVYNASVHVGTEAALVCPGVVIQQVATASRAFKSHWMYAHQRAYALSYYDFYDLCTFPVGKPETPYYRCHSGDLYQFFGTYYLFDQPVRVAEDIYYTNAVQDIWGSFARTGNPNVEADYLSARGYSTTEKFFHGFEWPQITIANQEIAALQYPRPEIRKPLYQGHCDLIEQFQTYPGL